MIAVTFFEIGCILSTFHFIIPNYLYGRENLESRLELNDEGGIDWIWILIGRLRWNGTTKVKWVR